MQILWGLQQLRIRPQAVWLEAHVKAFSRSAGMAYPCDVAMVLTSCVRLRHMPPAAAVDASLEAVAAAIQAGRPRHNAQVGPVGTAVRS